MSPTIAKILDIFEPQTKARALRLSVLLVLNGFAEMLSIGMLLPFFSAVSGQGPGSVVSRPVVELAAGLGMNSEAGAVSFLAVVVGLVFVLRNLFLFWVSKAQYEFIWRARAAAACRFHDAYLAMPFSFHLNRKTSVIVRNLTMSLQEVYTGVVMPVVLLASEAVLVVTIVTLMLVVSPVATISSAVTLVALVLLLQRVGAGRLREWGATGTRTNQQMIALATQALQAIREIKVMGCEHVFGREFAGVMNANSAAKMWNNTVSGVPRLVMETVAILGVLIAVAVSVVRDGSIAASLPVLGMFGVAAFRLIPSFSRISQHLHNLRFNQAVLDDIHADLAAFRAAGATDTAGEPVPLAFEREVRFEGVSYRYAGAERASVDRVDITIRKGESVAFVGPTGSGKSTLLNLLLGLLEPAEGRITVDGVSVTGSVRGWQSRLAYIPQNVVMIDGSLRENIVFRRPGRDQTALDRAVEMAQLAPVIARLPHGLDSPVGEWGSQLSGGERQRVGIARALYHDAELLVMDEATSALDARTEHEIARAIEELKGRRTVVVVAHRLSSVRQCDRLFYMEDGRIAAIGSFDELVRTHAGFADMVRKMSVAAPEQA